MEKESKQMVEIDISKVPDGMTVKEFLEEWNKTQGKVVFKDEKYYTPSTYEMHPGFEFELLTRKYYEARIEGDPEYKDVWNKVQFKASSPAMDLWEGQAKKQNVDVLVLLGMEHSKMLNKTGVPRTRVKYLDKEDIESLGWEYDDMYRDGGTTIFVKNDYTLENYNSNKATSSNKVLIRDSKKVVFDGDVKNKSELVKVLQMIGVKYD